MSLVNIININIINLRNINISCMSYQDSIYNTVTLVYFLKKKQKQKYFKLINL